MLLDLGSAYSEGRTAVIYIYTGIHMERRRNYWSQHRGVGFVNFLAGSTSRDCQNCQVTKRTSTIHTCDTRGKHPLFSVLCRCCSSLGQPSNSRHVPLPQRIGVACYLLKEVVGESQLDPRRRPDVSPIAAIEEDGRGGGGVIRPFF